jgi:prepilin-type N-terminal cleavage/methylation domain-containing protein
MTAKLQKRASGCCSATLCRTFTLLELLVTLAIIGLLSALLLPALRNARGRALNTVCVANFRQLTAAWLSFADDQGGRLVSAFYFQAGQVNSNAWVRGSMDDDTRESFFGLFSG